MRYQDYEEGDDERQFASDDGGCLKSLFAVIIAVLFSALFFWLTSCSSYKSDHKIKKQYSHKYQYGKTIN